MVEVGAWIRSAKSLLTATTREMDVGMEEDRIGMTVLAISSDAVAVIGTAIVTVTDGNVDAAIAIVIGTAAGGKLREEPEAESGSRKQEQELFACSCFLLLLLYSAPAVYGAFLTPSRCIRIMTYPASCGCGGTGRRAGLRSL